MNDAKPPRQDVLFRPASPAELPLVEKLHETWARELCGSGLIADCASRKGIWPLMRRPITMIESDSPDHRCIVAERRRAVVGLVATIAVTAPLRPRTPDPGNRVLAAFRALVPQDSLHICSLVVLAGCRRRGIASRLLSIAEIEARALGLSQLGTTLFGALAPAQRFFLSAGFRETARVRLPDPEAADVLGDIVTVVKPVRT